MKVGTIFFITLLTLVSVLLTSYRGKNENPDLSALYKELDKEIARSDEYQIRKLERLDRLKRNLQKERQPSAQISILKDLIDQYDSFNGDSTIYYIDRSIELLRSNGIEDANLKKLLIQKAQILSSTGLIQDATEILDHINTDELHGDLKVDYYNAYSQLYQLLIDYTDNDEINKKYRKLRDVYSDSLLQVISPQHEKYVLFKASNLYGDGNPEEAIEMLTDALMKNEPGDRLYSTIAYLLAFINHRIGNEKEYEKYLIISATSDVMGVIKENVSFSQLAAVNFDHRNIDRANLYIEKSFDDAKFFSSRIRTLEASRLLSIIEKAYILRQGNFHKRLRGYIISISLLAAALFISILFISKQFYKIRNKNSQIELKNSELSKLNKTLQIKEIELLNSNQNLKESNRVKEEYLNTFMKFGSTSIASMKEYVLSLKKYVNDKNKSLLLQKIDSNQVAEAMTQEFFDLFDSAFVKLYPYFIEDINKLLKPGQEIILKPDEKLSAELRILALMNLGITDIPSIADFLHYSVATVYTYRSKLKKRALVPQSFEAQIISLNK